MTTPESLSLMLARADAPEVLRRVKLVVVDEWHELLGSKRGVQLQLALARLRHWNPGLMTWGLSATLANLEEARDTLATGAVIVRGAQDKKVVIDKGFEFPNGVRLSPDQSLLLVADSYGRWVWSYQLQPDGSVENGQAFYRLETPD